MEAYMIRPTRYEPIYHLMMYLNTRGDFDGARMFAHRMLECKIPNDVLFVEEWTYEQGKKLAKSLLNPTPSDVINTATVYYLRKQWLEVLSTLKTLTVKEVRFLKGLDKFTYYDLQYIAYTWLQDKASALENVRMIFAMPLKQWEKNVGRLVGYYVNNYGESITSLSGEIQAAYFVHCELMKANAEAEAVVAARAFAEAEAVAEAVVATQDAEEIAAAIEISEAMKVADDAKAADAAVEIVDAAL